MAGAFAQVADIDRTLTLPPPVMIGGSRFTPSRIRVAWSDMVGHSFRPKRLSYNIALSAGRLQYPAKARPKSLADPVH